MWKSVYEENNYNINNNEDYNMKTIKPWKDNEDESNNSMQGRAWNNNNNEGRSASMNNEDNNEYVYVPTAWIICEMNNIIICI